MVTKVTIAFYVLVTKVSIAFFVLVTKVTLNVFITKVFGPLGNCFYKMKTSKLAEFVSFLMFTYIAMYHRQQNILYP